MSYAQVEALRRATHEMANAFTKLMFAAGSDDPVVQAATKQFTAAMDAARDAFEGKVE